MAEIRRRYVDGPWGQLHLRESGQGGVPLVCLHATAYSSRSFEPLMRAIDGTRHVIAVDAPGYGDSDAPPALPSIGAYAEAIAAALPERFDLLGYHTGVAIAAELAIARPAQVRRVALMGIPYFRALDFEAWRARLATPHRLTGELSQFDERWAYLVADRPAGLPLAAGFANFVDELKAWPDGSWAHQAMFDWDADARLPLIAQPVLVLNPPGHLAAPSRLAAALIANARVVELDVAGAPLVSGAALIAALLSPSADGSRRSRNTAGTAAADRPSRAG